ncbi:MAG: SDR family oxidoreductase, partial [Henriciella sp.]|nr:SDR family oxidoreductase [Henriciella sp.]
VRVCELAPTYVDTELLDNAEIHFPSRQEMLDNMAELIPLGRVARPEDIANAILLLASDEAAMITGSTLFVDGGQSSGMPSRHSQEEA